MDVRSKKRSLDFAKFKREDRYYDLRIKFKNYEGSRKVHKVIICEKSPLLNRLIPVKEDWPPVNEIELELPENISQQSFEEAIDHLYTDKSKSNSLIDLVNVLIYLEVDYQSILSLIRKSLPLDIKLTPAQIDILLLHRTKPLFAFYGNELPTNEALFFGQENETYLQEVYNREKENKSPKFPNYIPSKDKKWIHVDSFPPDSDFIFEAFGVKWKLTRFLYSFGCGYDEDLVKIYTQENHCEPDEPLNIRASLIIFSKKNKPTIEILQKEGVIPSEYKSFYMEMNAKSNYLGFSMPKFNEKEVRISFLIESF